MWAILTASRAREGRSWGSAAIGLPKAALPDTKGAMKRLSVWLLAALVILGATLRAELPDDQFVRVYNLIQQADNYLAREQPRSAAGKYLEVQAVL